MSNLKFITDDAGQRAAVHHAKHKAFTCYGCEKAQPRMTAYVAGQTWQGQRVRTCLPCWYAGMGRAR